MNNKYKLSLLAASVIAAGSGAFPSVAFSQDGERAALEEVIVTARRKEESMQDAPLSVNAVSDQALKDLNITNFADISSVVAGLTLDEDVVDSGASLRGVRYEVLAQAPASVEFYVNDVPTTALQTIQKVFDVSQVEVLRGPQGTLRGRAAPSGSITVTTQKAKMDQFGGYVDATLTDDGDQNYQAAINLPLVEDRLAVRVAGFWDESNLNDTSSAYGYGESSYDGRGYRLSLSAAPIDTVTIDLAYQRMEPERKIFPISESAAGASLNLDAEDRKSVSDIPETSTQTMEYTTLNIAWEISDDYLLNYTGGYTSDVLQRKDPSDPTNALDSSYPDEFFGAGTALDVDSDVFSHEIRLQSQEPLFGKLDFVVGGLYMERHDTVTTTLDNYVYIPNFITAVVPTVVNNFSDSEDTDLKEYSLFFNLNYYITDDTEVSFGARKIEFNNDAYQQLSSGTVLQNQTYDEDAEIFTASISHRFNESVMTYASWGTSWRYGPSLVGITTTQKSDLLESFSNLPSETSESFEIGVKTDFLDRRLRVNAAVYQQKFDNLAYRPSEGIYYHSFNASGADEVGSYNLQSGVPVEVNGVEVEVSFLATDQLRLNALLNYAKGEIQDGVIPCNDYQPQDGVPDSVSTPPTLAQIDAAAGSDYVTSCVSSQKTNIAPDFSASLSAEYGFTVAGMDAYVRGLYSYYGSTDNAVNNPVDDVDAYGIVNLYAGLRSPDDVWSAMLYVKNVADTEEVTARDASTGSVILQPFGSTVSSNYRAVEVTSPREIGINVHYNF